MTSGAGGGGIPDGITVGTGSAAFVVPERDLHWRFSRSSGPGGQGVNTTDSRVELSVTLDSVLAAARAAGTREHARDRLARRIGPRLVAGSITVVAAEHRSQLRNRAAARERLASLLTAALAPAPPNRRPTRPSAGARRRRIDDKTRRGRIKRLRGRPED